LTYTRREFLKTTVRAGAAAGVLAAMPSFMYEPILPEVRAAQSSQVINPTPALVYSQIDGDFTDPSKLKLTPLGEQLVSQNKSWMPAHEWADALPSPQTLYDFGSLSKGNAYMRLKYYEKGWIDDSRWLDILVDHIADPSVIMSPNYYFSDMMQSYLNPSKDYSGNSKGDWLFNLGWWGTPGNAAPKVSYWKAPFTGGDGNYWKIPSTSIVIGNSTIGKSPDFPQSGPHLIYEIRINIDKLSQYPVPTIPAIPIGDSFGFALSTDKYIFNNKDFSGSKARMWPKELAQNGFKPSAHGTSNIPSYSGTCELSQQPMSTTTSTTSTTSSSNSSFQTSTSSSISYSSLSSSSEIADQKREDLTRLAEIVIGGGAALGASAFGIKYGRKKHWF
jgi:hypothetical protein